MEFAIEFPLPRHGGRGLFMCVHGVILLTTYSAFHGAPSHQLSVLPLQSFHYSSAHWLFKNIYIFHRSVVLCFFGFFLEAFVFYTSWHWKGWGDFPVLSWRHGTGHLHVRSPSPVAIRAYCAEMLRKECLELSNTLA